MKSLTTYLFVMFMAIFWIFRIIVAFCYNLGVNFVAVPMDLNFEVVLLFLDFIAIILVIKRISLGGVFYLIGHGLYFGIDTFNGVMAMMNNEAVNYGNFMFSFIGIIIPILVLFDLLLDKNRKEHPVDKKTDWFYKNEDFDRKYDERADKNQYKF